jgi:hypothetical protein
MKNLATFEALEQASQLGAALRAQNLYSTVFGNRNDGYSVLVNDQDLGTANEVLTFWLGAPEVTAK